MQIWRTIKLAVPILFVSVFIFCFPAYAEDDAAKIRIAVFPFNDIPLKSLDMNIPLVLKSELLKHEFIEVVPVEVVKEKLYELEPSFMWTGEEGGVREGGIAWKIESETVETVKRNVAADLFVYGDYLRFDEEWRIITYVSEHEGVRPGKVITLSGTKESEIPAALTGLADTIADWVHSAHLIDQAEEVVRKYMGGLYSYPAAVRIMETLVQTNSSSMPLHALLLDLYLKEDVNREKAFKEGHTIIALYDPSQEEDVRYILSLSLDPFDVVARNYEYNERWKEAIDMRKKALELFPFKAQNHKQKLGEDYYLSALYFDQQGQSEKALENYEKAVQYINSSSEYYNAAKESIERLHKGNDFNHNK